MSLIGAHVSAAGGTDKAIDRVHDIGGNVVQLFSGSPRVWARPLLESIDVSKVSSKKQEFGVSSIFTHSLYLLNLASDNPELIRKSTEALQFDMSFDSHIKGNGIVVHVGSHQGRGWEAVKDQVVREIAGILEASPSDAHFLIENAAGQNGKVGGDLAEIKWMIDQLKSPQVGWCFDTCHGFAAGYCLNPADMAKGAIAAIQANGLADTLTVIHVNDSRDPYDSGRDRHANLGEGLIPPDEFQAFLRDPLISSKPLILEVPGEDNAGPDATNIERLKAMVG